MKLLFKFLMIPFAILGASQACAATYYVDYSGGSDGNTGLSVAAPWQHAPGDVNAAHNPATKRLQPGDTVIFKGGVAYNGTININDSGAQGNPIIYDGNAAGTWGDGKAVIDGQGDTLGINARPYGFVAQSVYNGNPVNGMRLAQAHIVINNFEITNLQYMGDTGSIGIIFDGGNSTTGTDIEIKNCYLHQIKKKAVAIAIQQGNVSITNTALTDNGRDFTAYAGQAGQVASHSITMGWAGAYGDYQRATAYLGPLNGSVNSITVYQDIQLTQPGWKYSTDFIPFDQTGYFYWVYNLQLGSDRGSGVGIRVAGYGNVFIHDNIIKEAFSGIAYVSGDGTASPTNINIYNNDVSNVNWGINPASGGSHDLDGVSIYGNTLHDFVDYLKDIYGLHTDGVFLFNSGGTTGTIKNVKFYNNYFYGNIGTATALLYLSGTVGISNVQVYNNVFAASAGAGYQIRQGGNVSDVAIYNNDFFRIPGEAKAFEAFSTAKNVTLRNNIYYYGTGYGGTHSFDAAATEGFSSDYNLLPGYTGITDAQILFGNYGGYTTQQWVSANLPFAHDQHSVLFQDPLFKSVPHHAAQVIWEGTPTRAYFIPNMDTHYDYAFNVNDYIEYDYDHVVRQIKASGTEEIRIGTLASTYSTSDNYFYLTDVTPYWALLPNSMTKIRIDSEILATSMIDLKLNAAFVNQYNERGFQETVKANHAAGAAVYAIVAYIDFMPPVSGHIISNKTKPGASILDWKDISSFVYDLSLKKDSPVIGKGINLSFEIKNFDKDGNLRPAAGAWDIGAYQFQANLPCDVSGNGRVTMYDAALVLKYTVGGSLSPAQQAQADINSDTVIDTTDAAAIARKVLGLN